MLDRLVEGSADATARVRPHLLIVLDVLLTERSVSAASRRMYMSQSAMSSILKGAVSLERAALPTMECGH